MAWRPLGDDLLAFRGPPLGRLGGRGVVRSTAWAAEVFRVEGAGRPSSTTSMASSWSEGVVASLSERGGASARGGGIGLAMHSRAKALWSSPQLGHRGGEV